MTYKIKVSGFNFCLLVAKYKMTGTIRCSWEDNIKLDLKEMGWEDVD